MNQVEDRSMQVPIPSRALLRSLAASALVLAGATACSRPDRDSGDNSAPMAQDTASIAPDQTGSTTGRDSATGVPTDAPRSATASPSAERSDTSMTADSAAGYRAMDRDTAPVANESDSARVTHDSSESSQAPSDTAAVESSSASVGAAAAVGATAAGAEMARDTSTIADQTDTVPISDTAGTLQASVDTSHTPKLRTAVAQEPSWQRSGRRTRSPPPPVVTTMPLPPTVRSARRKKPARPGVR